MHPRLAAALALAALLAAPHSAAAQTVYVAATSSTVLGSIEESGGGTPMHLLVVTNRSSVPVIVFGVGLSACENTRPDCGGRQVNVRIDPGGRRTVGRVQPRIADQAFSYRWSFSYHPDSSDARMVAALRESGVLAEAPVPAPRPVADSVVTTATLSRVDPARPVEAPAVSVADASPGDTGPLVAATEVDGFAQAASAVAPTRQFWVHNKSAYPIVVYSFNLATCLNVKQVCGRTPVDVRVKPGARAQVGRVDAQEKGKRYSYDWTYDWRPDTADAAVAAALRARGITEGSLGRARNLAIQPPIPVRPTQSVKERFRFRVARESILGSTQVKGGTVQATGACIDPGELAALERDTTITGSPAVAPRMLPNSLTLPSLPAELRDVPNGAVRVVVRWVVDVDGLAVPGSTSIVESQHGLVSVQACGAVIAAKLEPGRDASGQPVRTWVQLPLRIQR